MQDFEKLGSFYLGKEVSASEELVLYDAKDLTTHAVIIGMTGSGKTGLGVCLLEEALLDNIPVIAVDPKGDLGNLLLTFPKLQATDFKPWLDPSEATNLNISMDELAAQKAELWQQGLAASGQSGERIQTLRNQVEMKIYTPGATHGYPLSLLGSLTAPPAEIKADRTAYIERIAATTTGILALLGAENDPLSREHLLIGQLFEYYWNQNQDVGLVDLITLIQKPPFDSIGVMDIETVFPAKERIKLAMQLNALLASPSFAAWMQGDALNTENLLFTDKGKPKLSVMNIAHLSDSERQFFVTLLLNDILAWMRTQPGTGSLRAILYIDELFGYMPPLGNPATKPLLLTLLKQARAYGLGLVLSTQNPVDLDYKGLSNAGTWFIGRLQTEQDRARVSDGLLSASAEGLNKAELNDCFDQLGKRKFLLHNIHENAPVIMSSRWAMSYLAGPLSSQQIEKLSPKELVTETIDNASVNTALNIGGGSEANAQGKGENYNSQPTLVGGIDNYFVAAKKVVTDANLITYQPALMAATNILYEDSRNNISQQEKSYFVTAFTESVIPVDWQLSQKYPETALTLTTELPKAGQFLPLITPAQRQENYKDWERALKLWLRDGQPLTLFGCGLVKMLSMPGESESQFRQRLTLNLREARDAAIENLRADLTKKMQSLEKKLQQAEVRVEKEQQQASSKKVDLLVSAGTTLLGAFFGRKIATRTNTSRLGSTLRKASGTLSEHQDIERAKEALALIEGEIQALDEQFVAQTEIIKEQYDIEKIVLEPYTINAKSTNIHVPLLAVVWFPGVMENEQWVSIA